MELKAQNFKIDIEKLLEQYEKNQLELCMNLYKRLEKFNEDLLKNGLIYEDQIFPFQMINLLPFFQI
jgi:hypothetical protein